MNTIIAKPRAAQYIAIVNNCMTMRMARYELLFDVPPQLCQSKLHALHFLGTNYAELGTNFSAM